MYTVKEFLILMPYLCGSTNADRYSDLIRYQYEKELLEKDGIFSKNDIDRIDPFNRLETAFIFNGDKNKIEHCKKLVQIMLLNHYKNEHQENQWDDIINSLVEDVYLLEPKNVTITETLTVQEALSARWEG